PPGFLRPTSGFLLQVLDSAGEFGWQLERSGLFGDKVRAFGRGESGCSFTSSDPGWQGWKTPGLRKHSATTGNLQEKQRKFCNELNMPTDKGTQNAAAAVRLVMCKWNENKIFLNF
ncbi:hypothetical protein AMECASPLE_005379, partial [Ameca splendens]